MESNGVWVEAKAKERLSQNFVKTVLELSGYRVMDFGIENHNQDIIKIIKANYGPDTNRRLMSMPDFVVIDEISKETWLVEVKYRSVSPNFSYKTDNIPFRYGSIKSYLDFWEDATLIMIFNTSPYCLCVDFKDVNWNIHLKNKFENSKGNLDELWNFGSAYQVINNKFPKVTQDNFRKTLHILGIKSG